MIDVYCHECGWQLLQPGALMFSPPDEESMTKKLHLCETCWADVLADIDRRSAEKDAQVRERLGQLFDRREARS